LFSKFLTGRGWCDVRIDNDLEPVYLPFSRTKMFSQSAPALNSRTTLEDIPDDFKEIDIFKTFFDEHFIEQTNKYFKFIKMNFIIRNKSKLQC
jgi:hypothetical protein